MPLHSMTSYGFGEATDGAFTYTCEIRTLNSRYVEVSARMPRHLMPLEADLVNQVKAELKRGKVDLFIDCVRTGAAKDLPMLDVEALKHYSGILTQAAKALADSGAKDLVRSPDLAQLLAMEGVLISGNDAKKAGPRGVDAAEPHRAPLFRAAQLALKAASQARVKEGASLGQALAELLDVLESGRRAVAAKHDEILAHLHKAAQAGVPLKGDADIDEELTRLSTHIGEFRRLMATEEAAGRKLDFLCQEMHREVNTMSNKLVQTDVSQHTIEMKQTVERIRQQVQNIE